MFPLCPCFVWRGSHIGQCSGSHNRKWVFLQGEDRQWANSEGQPAIRSSLAISVRFELHAKSFGQRDRHCPADPMFPFKCAGGFGKTCFKVCLCMFFWVGGGGGEGLCPPLYVCLRAGRERERDWRVAPWDDMIYQVSSMMPLNLPHVCLTFLNTP